MSERELNVGASISTYTSLGVPYYDFKAPILPIGAFSQAYTPNQMLGVRFEKGPESPKHSALWVFCW